MNNPATIRHGRLSHTRIGVKDAARFLTSHTPLDVPTAASTALAIAGSAGMIVAVAVLSPTRAAGVAQATVGWIAPTTRMRTMLLDAAYWRAHAMGYRVVLVRGDDREPDVRIEVLYALTAPRRTRPGKGRQLTRHLWGRPDNHGTRP